MSNAAFDSSLDTKGPGRGFNPTRRLPCWGWQGGGEIQPCTPPTLLLTCHLLAIHTRSPTVPKATSVGSNWLLLQQQQQHLQINGHHISVKRKNKIASMSLVNG